MKTPITVRVEQDLLEAVRQCAQLENRSLTNFIETALKDRVKRDTSMKFMTQQTRISTEG